MTFLHAALLGGLALTAVPVLMHLLLKQQPKRIDFPALRLVRSRSKRNTQRLRIRHLLLLLLRMLLIAGMVFAAARPLLPAADWTFTWWNWLLCGLLLGGGVLAHRYLASRVASQPSVEVRERQKKRSAAAVWSTVALLTAVLVGIPYGNRVWASMKETPSAEMMNLPVAGIFVFDVSPSMSYTQQGKTLLDSARELVAAHVGRLPSGSRVAITDNASLGNLPFQVSLSSVPSQLERLQIRADARPLNSAVAAAFDAHEQDRERVRSEGDSRDRFVRRVYVFTDLAKSAWQFPDGSGLMETMTVESDASAVPGLFICDVGVADPQNRSLKAVRVRPERVARGGTVTVSSVYDRVGFDDPVTAELLLSERGDEVRLAQEEVVQSGQPLNFLPTITADDDFAQGRVTLISTDPLAIDDARFVTIAVDALPKLLLVTQRADDVFEMRAALEGDQQSGVASRYESEVIKPQELSAAILARQDVVCLVNVPSLRDQQWTLLEDFVREGGGLAVMLGSLDINATSYNRAAALSVLPARLDVYRSRPARDPARLVFESSPHPLVERLSSIAESDAVLETAEITRFWRTEPLDGARVLARYTADGLPALMERRIGKGLVTVLTTAVDIKPRRESWNNLPQVDGAPWVYIVFMDQWMRHLARSGTAALNFTAGETPRFDPPEGVDRTQLLLNTPDLRTTSVDPGGEEGPVVLKDATVPGHYSVTTADGTKIHAFSINHRPEESDLTQATEGDLVTIFGEGNFAISDDLTQLSEEIDLAGFGQEAFPVMLLLAIAFFVGETLLSSRFYGDEQTANPPRSSSRGASREAAA